MKTRCLFFIFLCFYLGKFSPVLGQDNYNMWYQYLMSAKVTDKSTFTALSQYRSFDFAYDTRLILVSAYYDYEVVKGFRPAAGYMFVVLESYGDSETKKIRYEHRPFQQVTFKSAIGRVSASHRFRVEERLLNNPDDVIIRLRYLLSLNIPFYKSGGKEKFYGIFKNEVRLNTRKGEVFDSNRITVGTGMKIGKKSALELGFIAQLEDGPPSNYGCIVFRNNFDWRKKKI